MPLFAVGLTFALDFWMKNWYMGVIFLLVLGGLDGFFFYQWKLFQLLEKEDWQALRSYLEGEIFEKSKITGQNIRFYINACLLTAQASDIHKLRTFVQDKAPSLARKWALSLGIPLILEGKSDPIVQYFGGLRNIKGVKEQPWIKWAFSFGLLLGQALGKLKDELWPLTDPKNIPSLRLLSYYLLNNISSGDPEIAPRLDKEIPRFRALMSRIEWEKHLEKARDKYLLLVFLNRFVDEALDWLFSTPAR